MLATPLSVRDVVLDEAVWAATKGTFSATAVLLVGSILGVVGRVWQYSPYRSHS